MTGIGKAFAGIAYDVVRLHGMGSNKMVVGYEVYEDDNEIRGDYNGHASYLEQLVKLGYLRKFVGSPYLNNKGRNWRYRFMVRNVCFGLTAKGWEVAEQYIAAAYGAEEFKRLSDYHKGSVDTFSAPDFDEWCNGWDDFVNGKEQTT